VAIYSHEKYLSTDLGAEKGILKAAQRSNVSCRKEREKAEGEFMPSLSARKGLYERD